MLYLGYDKLEFETTNGTKVTFNDKELTIRDNDDRISHNGPKNELNVSIDGKTFIHSTESALQCYGHVPADLKSGAYKIFNVKIQ